MENDKEVEIALGAINLLNSIHDSFVTHLRMQEMRNHNAGKLYVLDDDLVIETLGVKLFSTHRPVKRSGHLGAIEYVFETKTEAGRYPLFALYMGPSEYVTGGGRLYEDPDFNKYMFETTNTYVVGNLINMAASKLLASDAFNATTLPVAKGPAGPTA